MSRMIKMGVACGLECLKDIPSEKVDAIITATGLGCLADTEKFMNALMDNREQMLNPTAFIQSTFNTLGAQLALLLKIHAYNVTYVHRGLSFESALIDGIMSIAEGKQHVLAGAMDEITPTSHIIQQRLGLLKGTTAGEGAQFFLLSAQKEEQTFAELKGVDTFITRMSVPEISNRMHHFSKNLTGLHPKTLTGLSVARTGRKQQIPFIQSWNTVCSLMPCIATLKNNAENIRLLHPMLSGWRQKLERRSFIPLRIDL